MENYITLEYILQKHFGLKSSAFLKQPKVKGYYCDGEKDYEYMTQAGLKAYGRMTDFIYDLAKIGVNGLDEGILIDDLDSITNEY